MSNSPSDVALLGFVVLNVVVFGSAWRFTARRVTTSVTQAMFDAALLGYVIQYVAVGITGVLGLLRTSVVSAVALVASACLVVMAGPNRRATTVPPGRTERATVVGLATFTCVMAIGFAVFQFSLPVMANDALTYHFPAAAQWIQRGRIGLFPTWFFNPSNTYSPLAGSMFIAWTMLPFGSDVMARFVQVPALLCVGLGVYRLGRQLDANPPVAAAIAVAAVLCRPLFMAELMGKDDLFVAFAFVAILVALAPPRASEPFAAARLGLAVGLLLALKYTTLLAVPMLLLAIDGPVRAGWRARRWTTSAAIAAVVAGPWYLRNWIATGNPLFPLNVTVAGVHLFHGLFSTTRSAAFTSVSAEARIVLGGSYGVPIAVASVAMIAWLTALMLNVKRWTRDPIARACVLGPPLGLALFFCSSPFPEVRFVLPVALLLMGTASVATGLAGWAVAALPIASVATLSIAAGWVFFGPLVLVAVAVASAVAWGDALVRNGPAVRRWIAVAAPVGLLAGYAYVHWRAACNQYVEAWAAEDGGWSVTYRDVQPLWQAVTRQVPADATVAYTDLYLVYPLQGAALGRKIGYAPTRPGVQSPADLPWLGAHLTGEQLVIAADAATVAQPDPNVWRENLRRIGAQYLIIGHAVPGPPAIEATWATADPRHFEPLYAGPAGQVFRIRPAD